MKAFFLSLSLIIICTTLHGQATVRGKITDNLGESVIGATVVLKNNPSVGAITDFDGNYSLELASNKEVTLLVSFIGFQNVERTVNLEQKEILIWNIGLVPKDFELEGVTIEAKADRAGDFYMEKIKKNSATSIDYISNETMRKVGDNDVSAAIQRVSGVSSVGGFVTVRGLADRYVLTSVNGMMVPTLDPFTNNINLDIFPAGLVDNLVITKTGIPDLPGDWSGAFISLETKDFPDQFFVEFSSSIGINGNAHFNEIVGSKNSSTDWLGWDNGMRDVPDGVPVNQNEFPRPEVGFNTYRQFELLGLEPFLNSYGITQNTNVQLENAYGRLGLVELGLLPPALFGSNTAVNQAISDYKNQYDDGYFFRASPINRRLSGYSQQFNTNWLTTSEAPPVNTNVSFTIGNRVKLFGKDFGFIAGFRHSRNTQSSSSGEINRTLQDKNYNSESDGVLTILDLDVEASQQTSNLSALFSGTMQLNTNNTVNLIFMPNFLGENNARIGSGIDQSNSDPIVIEDQFYQERRHLIYQFHSNHYIPGIASKVNLDFSYTDGRRNEPDFKQIQYNFENDSIFRWSTTAKPTRAYRQMDDDVIHGKAAIEIPFSQEMRSLGKLSIGGAYLRNERENLQTIFDILPGARIITDRDNPLPQSLYVIGPEDSSFNLVYNNQSTELDRDIGFKEIYSMFIMSDYNINTRLRIVGGLRFEYTDIYADIFTYYERDLPVDSEDRRVIGGIKANPAQIVEQSYLPSINFIYKLREREDTPINLRVNYFESIGRPSFREISPLALDDYILQGQVSGNPELELTRISNFDARVEFYFENNNSISFSSFFKYFENHIELIEFNSGFFSWDNADNSIALGTEIEGVWNINQQLSFRGNLSFIYSRTTVTEPVEITRRMFGQAPYIANGILSHQWREPGITSTVSYNVQGPKIALVTIGEQVPDVFEVPVHRLDLKLGKNLGDHFQVSFSVRNILNPEVRRAYNFDRGYDLLAFDTFRWGRTYSIGINYKL